MTRKGQNGRNTIDARKVTTDNKAPKIITVFSRYLERAVPTNSLEISAATANIPTSMPISLSFEPDLAR
jgi:hypothetical protein